MYANYMIGCLHQGEGEVKLQRLNSGQHSHQAGLIINFIFLGEIIDVIAYT